jgi:hypothetical protein
MPPASHTSESPPFNRLHSGLELLLGGLLLGGLGWLMGPLMASAANWWLAVGLLICRDERASAVVLALRCAGLGE